MENICPDCGPATVSHVVERWSSRSDAILAYIQKPAQLIWLTIKPGVAKLRVGRLAPGAARALAAVKLGSIHAEPDAENNWRAKVIWEEAQKRGIAMKEFRLFGLSRDIFYASYNGDTRGFDGLPRPRNARESSLDWMDNKGIIIKKFTDAGIPMPRGKSCSTIKQAEKVFAEITGVDAPAGSTGAGGKKSAVIVKPTIGSRSRHTYVNITDLPTLRHAFKKAKELCPWVVVEEELSGYVFRITIVGGEVAGVMRREPPHVIGNGKDTVAQLIAQENKNPLRQGPIFHELPTGGEETIAALRDQGLTLDSIPAQNQMVIVHQKVSRSFGASTTEIVDIHPDNQELFIKIGKVLDDPLVGVDFMIDDMAISWRQQKCGIIECNSLPFIDLHHYPLKGPARNVAGVVWDLNFPTSKK